MGNLKALRKALSPLLAATYTKVVKVSGQEFTLRALSCDEAVQVASSLSGSLNPQSDTNNLHRQMRVLQCAALSHSIIAIDDMRMDGPEVDTGEVDDKGAPLFQDKVEAVAEVLGSLLPEFIDQLYAHYETLDQEVDAKIAKEVVDPQKEIERLESEIRKIKEKVAVKDKMAREADPAIAHVEDQVRQHRAVTPAAAATAPRGVAGKPRHAVVPTPAPQDDDGVLYDVEVPDLEESSFGAPAVRVPGLTR